MKKIIILSLLVIAGILFFAQIKRGFLSILILADSVRPPGKALMGKFIAGPLVEKVTVPGRGGLIAADLYSPRGKGGYFPLLLVHGVNPDGKDDEQLVLLAKDLSRAGFLVLVPDFVGMKSLRPRISDAEDVLRCFLYLKGREHARGRGGGMLGISYGAGPVLLAAADPRVRDKVSVVATLGGYYDLRNVMLFATTGAFEYGGHRGLIRPDSSLRWMLAYRNLDLLRSRPDRETLRKIIEKRNRYELAGAGALAKSLGDEGRALYAFLVNADPERFYPLYENLPVSVREYAYQLSPARAMRYSTSYFIIAHGTDDYSIPYTESMRLADAVGDAGRVHLALLPQFMHIEPFDPSAESSAGDRLKRSVVGGWKLLAAIYDLLEKGEQR
jgi:dienelactone hydrolase